MTQGVTKFSNNYRKASGGSFSVGRSIGGNDSGNNSFTLGLSPAPISGSYLVVIFSSDVSGSLGITGGTNAWTELNSGDTENKVYVHKCAASEPTTYTFTYGGASKADAAWAAILEILVPNASNPDANAANTNSLTAPSATSAAASDIGVLLVADNSGTNPQFTTPPSGWTTQVTESSPGASSSKGKLFIATKTAVGSGSISPGSWSSNGGTLADKQWLVLFKA